MKLVCQVCLLRRAAEAHFESDPFLRQPYYADSDFCPICLALDRTGGFVRRCYSNADVFRRSLGILPCDLIRAYSIDSVSRDRSIRNA